MRKQVITIFMALLTLATVSQTTVTKMFTVAPDGAQRGGILTLPADYKTGDSMALFTFYHGAGEAAAVPSLATVNDIKKNGAPVGKVIVARSPVDGKTYRIATLGLQGLSGRALYPEQGAYVLRNDVLKNYKISQRLVSIGGLSIGGESTWESITMPGVASLYNAAVPMSSPSSSIIDYGQVVANQIKVWAFHGASDGGLTDVKNTNTMCDSVDARQTGLTRRTIYPGGHGGWPTYWDTAYRENVSYVYRGVKATKNMNAYEFCLAAMQGADFRFGPASTPTVPPPAVLTRAVPVATLNGTTASLDPTGSTGNGGVSSWYWSYAGPAGASRPSFADGRADGGNVLFVKQLTGLSTGVWTLTLTVQDKYGGNNTASTTVTVGGAPPPIRKVLQVSTAVVDGSLSVTIYWSDGTTEVYK